MPSQGQRQGARHDTLAWHIEIMTRWCAKNIHHGLLFHSRQRECKTAGLPTSARKPFQGRLPGHRPW
eukprot:4389280-Pyramimonas_sp.AAC.1